MGLFKKIFISERKEKELNVRVTWSVSWYSRYGEFCGDVEKEKEFFISKEEAESFANDLKSAFKLIRHKSLTSVKIEKQDKNFKA